MSTDFDGIKTRQNVPSIQGPSQILSLEQLNDINYLDKDSFDHSQFDIKTTEKNIYSKYLVKEVDYIAKMVY
jgi:hypothetical protein